MQLRSMLLHTEESRGIKGSALFGLFHLFVFKTVKTNVVNLDYLNMIVHQLKHHVL